MIFAVFDLSPLTLRINCGFSIYVRAKLISLGSVCVYIVIVAVNHVSCFVVVENAEY